MHQIHYVPALCANHLNLICLPSLHPKPRIWDKMPWGSIVMSRTRPDQPFKRLRSPTTPALLPEVSLVSRRITSSFGPIDNKAASLFVSRFLSIFNIIRHRQSSILPYASPPPGYCSVKHLQTIWSLALTKYKSSRIVSPQLVKIRPSWFMNRSNGGEMQHLVVSAP